MRRLRSSSNIRVYCWFVLAVSVLAFLTLPLVAQDSASPEPIFSQGTRFAVSPPLFEVAKLPRVPRYGFHMAAPVHRIPERYSGLSVDPVEQNTNLAPGTDYVIGLDFLGLGNGFPGYTVPNAQPDTNLAVGDNQIVEWVNFQFAIFDKYNPSIYTGPIDATDLFSALGGPCADSDDGDAWISAQWDNAAHRWLMAQNANIYNGPPYYTCLAVSTSADATGTYYLYQFSNTYFPDFPDNWGRWVNTWTQSMDNYDADDTFVGAGVCAYDRTKLLNGNLSPGRVCFQLSPDDNRLLPADIDSPTNPPSAEDQFLLGCVACADTSHLALYSLHTDWVYPSKDFITGNHHSQSVTVPTYSGPCNGSFVGNCVPQKSTSNELDSLANRLMYRFAYFNDPTGGVQHWYANHSVQAANSHSGVRWYEFQAPQIAQLPFLKLFQSGTYAPDGNWRWAGSVAGDRNNDILVGFSESCGDTCPSGMPMYPSIFAAGRLKSTAAGMLEPEVALVTGTGSQLSPSHYWGNYSTMRLDPDGCTFWYANEYYTVSQDFGWSTQIGSIKFAGCRNPAYDGYIELCKQSDPDYPVNGTFNFTLTAPFFNEGPYAVPVGTCSAPIEVPSGEVTINEAPQIGVAVDDVTAYSYDQYGNYIDELDSWTAPDLTATVTVVPGGVNLETVATFTNYAAPPGQLKICKVAGNGVAVGTLFYFTTTDGTTQRMDQVEAGPSPGGYCVVDGSWPINDPVTITEVNMPSGVSVSSTTVNQGQLGQCNPASSSCTIATIGSGITEVTYTDVVLVVQGSCQPSESLSVMVVPTGNGCNLSGGCVVAWVPESAWIHGSTGVAVGNIEGGYIVGAPLTVATADYINSCASDPLLTPPQTVCTASSVYGQSNKVYVITGNNPPTVTSPQLQSSGSGVIYFSGGQCTNCGIAMDAIHSKAVVALSLNGAPGYQFLDLTNNPANDSVELPAIPSPAGQISEDILIDPIGNRLLSPSEGYYKDVCNGGICHPNYEIGNITYNTITGFPTVQFFQNRLDTLAGFPGGDPDSAAEDCGAQIALSSIEGPNPSTPFIADLTQFHPSGSKWTDPSSGFFALTGSLLNRTDGSGTESGPIAIAQGGSHEGILGQETFNEPANTITAFKLSVPFSASAPFANWITCDIGTDPNTNILFLQGEDPHTISAYQDPNPPNHSFAVIANQREDAGKANTLAIVDLDMMLALPQVNGICTAGNLESAGVVRFVPLCSPSPSCQE